MSNDEVKMENRLPFLYMWRLERVFSFAPSSEKLWEYSTVFTARGYRWKLALNLGKVEANEGESYLSLFLSLLDAASPLPLHIKVVLESSIIDENCNQCNKRKVSHRFRQSIKSEGCHPYLISLETLKCPSSGFLVVEIIDVVIRSEKNVSLSPKPKDSSLAYTWKIDGFSKLTKQSYTSGPFLYKDYLWFLRLDPKGISKGDKSISLYLCLDDVSILFSNSKKISVEYYIDWVDQIKGENYQLRGSSVIDWTSQYCGDKKFLSLDELHEPSKGLIVNDTCIIKIGFVKCDVSD